MKYPNHFRKWSRPEMQEECIFILDTLAGTLSLAAFNDDPACFSRYCYMQANTAAHSGFIDLADVMTAAGNRAARNAAKGAT